MPITLKGSSLHAESTQFSTKVQEEKDKLAGYEQMMAQVKERLAQMK